MRAEERKRVDIPHRGRRGKKGGALARDPPQHAVREAGGFRASRLLHERDRGVDRGEVGDAIQKQQRIRPDADRGQHLTVEIVGRPRGGLLDGVIEDGATAQHAEHDLREERDLAWIVKSGGGAIEQNRRECAGGLDPPQDPKGLTPRIRDAQSDLRAQGVVR